MFGPIGEEEEEEFCSNFKECEKWIWTIFVDYQRQSAMLLTVRQNS